MHHYMFIRQYESGECQPVMVLAEAVARASRRVARRAKLGLVKIHYIDKCLESGWNLDALREQGVRAAERMEARIAKRDPHPDPRVNARRGGAAS